jgi:hypothetical protein
VMEVKLIGHDAEDDLSRLERRPRHGEHIRLRRRTRRSEG